MIENICGCSNYQICSICRESVFNEKMEMKRNKDVSLAKINEVSWGRAKVSSLNIDDLRYISAKEYIELIGE